MEHINETPETAPKTALRGIKIFFAQVFTRIVAETFVKGAAVAESLRSRPVLGVTLTEGVQATFDQIVRVHGRDYVIAVRDGGDLAGTNGLGWDDGLYASAAASTGSLIDAVRWALVTRGIAGALSSGLHHAKRNRGAGFCTFNGLVIAAHEALAAGAKRVLILDLDAHCGGGTASLIDGVNGIEQLDISVNGYDSYVDTSNARLVMAKGSNYIEIIERELANVVDPSSIDLIIYNAGMDAHEMAGGMPGITTEVIAERERMVFAWAWTHQIPVAFTLAGGYQWGGLTMDELVDLHRITIATAAAVN